MDVEPKVPVWADPPRNESGIAHQLNSNDPAFTFMNNARAMDNGSDGTESR